MIGQQDIPGALLGEPDVPSVKCDWVYSTVRTLWVEPLTGGIIKGTEQVNQRLVNNGKQAPIIQGTLAFTPTTVNTNVDYYKPLARGLWFVTKAGPIGGWILGPICILIGITLIALAARAGDDDEWDDEDEDEDELETHNSR